MRFQRRLPTAFEVRSVTLFAALALGQVVAQAQSTTPPMTAPPAANSPAAQTPAPVGDVFKRADTNGDQRLSRDEAKQVPSLAQHFDRLDTDKDGSLTLAEFGKGMAAK